MSTTRTEWINLVNVVSCIAVVFLHTNGCFWTFSTERYWFTANIIESIFYFAVPCFFMITGATLMDYRDRYSLRKYFSKRVTKTVIPFLAWSIVGIIYRLVLKDIDLTDITPAYIWDGIINTTAVPIYWFFPALFGIYLTIPLLAAVDKTYRREIFLYTVIVGFAIGELVPFVLSLITAFKWNGALNMQVGGYVLYVLIGYLIFAYEISPVIRRIIYVLSLCGLAAHIIGTYYLSINAGEIIQIYKGYNNVPCVFYSVGIYIFCKYNGPFILKSRVIKKMVDLINPYTLGIYLTQYFVFTTMVRLFDINTLSIIYRLGAPFIVIPTGMIIVVIMRKIPGFKRMVP